MTVRLEGGPFDGFHSKRPFAFDEYPAKIGVIACSGCTFEIDHELHIRNLDRNPDQAGFVVYRLADIDDQGVLYQHGNLTADPVTAEFEVTAA